MMPNKKKLTKVSLIGLFGQQNLGNEYTLKAIIFNVRKYIPDVEISCICTDPGETAIRYNIGTFPIVAGFAKGFAGKARLGKKSLPMRLIEKIFIRIPMELIHWIKALNILMGTQMLIFPGSGILSDYSTRALGWPYYIFKWSIIAKLCRCKLLFLSIGAGPISHPLSKWFLKRALSMADYRSYRDNYSKQYLAGIGFDTGNDPVYPDLAFSLPVSIATESDSRNGQKPIIGVGLMNYYGKLGVPQGNEEVHRDFMEKLCKLVTWFLEHKYTVRLLIGDVLYDNRVKEDLIELLQKGGIKYDVKQLINEPINSVEQLALQLRGTDIVVSPRFHNVILTLMLNKLAVSLSYHEKFTELMEGVGLVDYCHDLDHLDIDKLIQQVLELERNSEKLKRYIKTKTEAHRLILDEQYRIIFNEFLLAPAVMPCGNA